MKAVYDEIADWYEQIFEPQIFTSLPGLSRQLVDLLGKGTGVCLEVGCGTGAHAAAVKALGWTPIGVDLSTGMLGYAMDRLPVLRADAEHLPFPSDSLPAVVSVMAHTDMPGYPTVLREVRRVLRPGGIFVHIGVHPCFCGHFADRSDPDNIVIGAGYGDGSWTKKSWTDRGVRNRVGAAHWPMSKLLNAFTDVGFTLERFGEGDEATPVTFSVRARKQGA
ncbi:class I SAM-dependent methyltransferase [Kutzneria sp. NPDC052558]|uniref:class I SAM-dependent methyltransferase n=1 Tax=Kutzneria sp. NPDC052558 TaxID=3364121 RepID=UPI0037C982BA